MKEQDLNSVRKFKERKKDKQKVLNASKRPKEKVLRKVIRFMRRGHLAKQPNMTTLFQQEVGEIDIF